MSVCVANINSLYQNSKQHSKVKYLGCMVDETMSGETMALSVINKINNKLKFLYQRKRFLTPTLRRLLRNALNQPHFDCTCSAWYPNLTKKNEKQNPDFPEQNPDLRANTEYRTNA